MYIMRARGDYFWVNSKGQITQQRTAGFSGQWLLHAIVPKWNMRPWNQFQWPGLRKRLDDGEVIEGYIYDIDHGTLRFWGGSYMGKLPKAKIWKEHKT